MSETAVELTGNSKPVTTEIQQIPTEIQQIPIEIQQIPIEIQQIPIEIQLIPTEITNGKNILDLFKSQDFTQKVGIIPTVLFELYKVMVSSFLILFVPQNCDGHVCTLSENLVTEDNLYTSGLVINFITMFSFLIFYLFEIQRETKLITYLEVNTTVPGDNESVGKSLELLPEEKKLTIYSIDKKYQLAGWSALTMFVVNTILSGFVVYKYYLDNQTTSTYITNILFMVTKLGDIYSTVNTDKNIFYSAYHKCKLQYNDVDPDKKIEHVGVEAKTLA